MADVSFIEQLYSEPTTGKVYRLQGATDAHVLSAQQIVDGIIANPRLSQLTVKTVLVEDNPASPGDVLVEITWEALTELDDQLFTAFIGIMNSVFTGGVFWELRHNTITVVQTKGA